MVDRTGEPDYKPPLPGPPWSGSAQVAQLVEHATENRSVGGSIPPLGTTWPDAQPPIAVDDVPFAALDDRQRMSTKEPTVS